MIQNPQRPVSSIAFPILIALSISHCLNDLLQSVITATYPLFKDDLALSFAQIGLITLVYQMSASVFQPVFGLFFDKRPVAWDASRRDAFHNDRDVESCFCFQSALGASFGVSDWYRFFCSSPGSITHHFTCFRRTKGACTIFVSGRWQSGWFIRPSVGGIIGCSLWSSSHSFVRYFGILGHFSNDSCLQMV